MQSSRIAEWLSAGPLLADGAWGTEFQKRGLPPGECPDLWNLAHPDRVEAVASAYCDAGSRIILTNTFRANAISLPEADIRAVNRAGAEISRRAARGRARVAASIGPSGKMLLAGDITAEALSAAFAAQAQALADAGADALLVETMSDIEEARIALRAALTAGLPVVVSFAFDTGRNKDRTMTGATPEQVAAAMAAEGADAVGANCGTGIQSFAAVCRRLHAACDLPVWIKPNAGLPVMENGQLTYRTTPAEFAAYVPGLIEAGASFIGGCCGTSPAFIEAMAPCI
ncbi:MAG TPA: homocysteine S-methyltransferase family protein [Bryobacteraceae bacterium]|nr:homocysteine S-methyltransferase family protein [Bryobacteraceae bacterium]